MKKSIVNLKNKTLIVKFQLLRQTEEILLAPLPLYLFYYMQTLENKDIDLLK